MSKNIVKGYSLPFRGLKPCSFKRCSDFNEMLRIPAPKNVSLLRLNFVVYLLYSIAELDQLAKV